MLKLTKTGIGLLTKQYKSVLKKCLLLNLGLLGVTLIFGNAFAQRDDNDSEEWHNYTSDTTISIIPWQSLISIYNPSAVAYISKSSIEFYTAEGLYTALSNSSFKLNNSSYATGIDFAGNVTAGSTNASHLATTGAVNQLLNYYYTFRVDERDEVIEFAEELRSNKKDMSSLDFMPIKSSSDLRINLIKAEDPLTFSAKTRDDSLALMEVCHA